MKFRVEIAATARADIREAARWLVERASSAAADRWLAGLYKAMSSLEKQPERCPIAAESHKFPVEIRELLKGGKHRVIFWIYDRINALMR